MDIYVGNLPYEVTDAELQAHFEKFGKVTSARVVMDKATGRAKGFGFVEMPDRAEAEKAIAGTNGVDFRADFNHFVAGPATFDWDIATYQPTNIGITHKVGPGAWVTPSRQYTSGSVTILKTLPPMMG